jgi:hypothetical protein
MEYSIIHIDTEQTVDLEDFKFGTDYLFGTFR